MELLTSSFPDMFYPQVNDAIGWDFQRENGASVLLLCFCISCWASVMEAFGFLSRDLQLSNCFIVTKSQGMTTLLKWAVSRNGNNNNNAVLLVLSWPWWGWRKMADKPMELSKSPLSFHSTMFITHNLTHCLDYCSAWHLNFFSNFNNLIWLILICAYTTFPSVHFST